MLKEPVNYFERDYKYYLATIGNDDNFLFKLLTAKLLCNKWNIVYASAESQLIKMVDAENNYRCSIKVAEKQVNIETVFVISYTAESHSVKDGIKLAVEDITNGYKLIKPMAFLFIALSALFVVWNSSIEIVYRLTEIIGEVSMWLLQ